MDIKPIETEYKGYLFRSRLEARWAVFFDACGVKWEYEPEGFYCGDGVLYLPDFLLHDVIIRYNQENYIQDLWVEVKGTMTKDDARKIWKFWETRADNKIIVLLGIPNGNDLSDLFYDMQEMSTENIVADVEAFNFVSIDGDSYGAYPVITKQKNLAITGRNYIDENLDEEATVAAYKKARQARFEHKKPTVTDPEHIKNLLSFIEPAKCDYYKWLTVLQSVKNSLTANGVDDETAFEIFDEWCARDNSVNPKGKPRYNRAHNKKAWDSMTKYRFGINTLEKTAEKFSYRAVAE